MDGTRWRRLSLSTRLDEHGALAAKGRFIEWCVEGSALSRARKGLDALS
jgi:hypothetical protein